ncbi:MAG: holo-ACP synthase [Candidatus Aminicenantes bacterium]|nr:MAG: holo-ACP synthase [Candidatus Aminicenantes bacterium]
MVKGIGIDIIEVERVKKLAEKNSRFLERVFTDREISYCSEKINKYQHYAARFAAKEAFIKAIGRRIGWREVELINLASGKPQLEIKSKEQFSFKEAHVSISHLAEYAVATVILVK